MSYFWYLHIYFMYFSIKPLRSPSPAHCPHSGTSLSELNFTFFPIFFQSLSSVSLPGTSFVPRRNSWLSSTKAILKHGNLAVSMGGSGVRVFLCTNIFGINSPSGDLKFKNSVFSTCLLKFLKYPGWSSGFLNGFLVNLHIKGKNQDPASPDKGFWDRYPWFSSEEPETFPAQSCVCSGERALWSGVDQTAPTPRLHLPLDPAFLPAFPTAAAKNNGGTRPLRHWGCAAPVAPPGSGWDGPSTGCSRAPLLRWAWAGLGRLRFLLQSRTSRV